MTGQRLEPIQDTEVAGTAQVQTLTREDSRHCPKKRPEHGVRVFSARGAVVRGLHGTVSFTGIIIFHLNMHRIFFLITTCKWKQMSVWNLKASVVAARPCRLSVCPCRTFIRTRLVCQIDRNADI